MCARDVLLNRSPLDGSTEAEWLSDDSLVGPFSADKKSGGKGWPPGKSDSLRNCLIAGSDPFPFPYMLPAGADFGSLLSKSM